MPTWKSAGERYLEGEVLSPDVGIRVVVCLLGKALASAICGGRGALADMGILYRSFIVCMRFGAPAQ